MRVVVFCRYDGSGYFGFQIQPDKITVQEVLEKALKKIHKGQDIRIYMSGRTDSGVHGYMQPIHFDTPYKISEEAWLKSLNSNLPKDVRILAAKIVDDNFHVRYDAVSKTYEYRLYLGKYLDPFLVNYVGHCKYNFDYKKAEESLKYFLGRHDFTSFCSSGSSVEDKVRTITDFNIKREGDIVVFNISGDGFLYNMVRIIIGTIVEVANGKYSPQYINEIILKKDRAFAGKTADASGLYLKKVYYKNEEVNQVINSLK
ncbi:MULTISPECIES: tRNA pseudouridine(38-40) synthase TruA [unclassified Gemella]|uniref:tRNA pseudouridine(38-40) synthase TruA n=1 Tax=unclassified Gemella TaxID=2624949 RepID=UPI0010735490|nr:MULTISPECIES: tRNA pseudouridine(38-40) synthase TruA [unclassified Gemella]MBF0710219.1 tRNA pseudouridine(38-40) synthase TruA [Gemella sp. GL1.1]MBF0746519.1 tRNA pseudouridine(38-40) synthase TruA [Gemella sp. 19428wG2_WT2a]NYS27563.1 tRNA pseudouridine(38-40) synthase TruA [Gemella sp. GL1]TFU60297.1 tRNA pseudouridine(38-40) synthase TruA [Gemella sp. WT2a]